MTETDRASILIGIEEALANVPPDQERALALARRLGSLSPDAAATPDHAAMPVRERLLAGLELLGVPCETRMAAMAAEACTGLPVVTRQVASLRRSEERSWLKRPNARPSYIVPALHFERFNPLRGVLTPSTWEAHRRIVGPLSPRLNHLRAAASVGRRLSWARAHSPALEQALEPLAWRFARTIPGALVERRVDPDVLVETASAEIALNDEEDLADREFAAVRLQQLDEHAQVFGTKVDLV